jgi:hypothetical protein
MDCAPSFNNYLFQCCQVMGQGKRGFRKSQFSPAQAQVRREMAVYFSFSLKTGTTTETAIPGDFFRQFRWSSFHQADRRVHAE